jgi:hypothetical protein
MGSKKAARAESRFTPEEEAVLKRGEARAVAQVNAEGRLTGQQQIWRELDAVVSELMADYGDQDMKGRLPTAEARAWGELRGQAQGLAFSLAVLMQPFGERDVDAIRAEAMRRHHAAEHRAQKPKRTKIV